MPFRGLFLAACISLLWAVSPVAAQKLYNLKLALQTAKAKNPFLKTEQFNMVFAQADVVSARLRPNPILNNQTLQLVQPASFTTGTEWHNAQNRQVWWQLTKPIQLPAHRFNKMDFARQQAVVAENNYREAERNLFREVAAGWLGAWTARKQLEFLILAQANVDSLVMVNKIRLKNQVITQTDLLRTELLANQLSLQIKNAQQDYANQISNLQFLLGTQQAIDIDTADTFDFALPPFQELLSREGLANRSDLMAAKSVLNLAHINRRLQQALAFPQPELGFIWNPQNQVPYLGFIGTIDIPVFSRNQGERRKALALQGQAEQSINTIQMQIASELRAAYHTYQGQQENLNQFKGLLQQAERILENVRYGYLRGGTTLIDFLEAQRSWTETRQQYFETLQAYRQSYIQVLYTSGLINQLAQ